MAADLQKPNLATKNYVDWFDDLYLTLQALAKMDLSSVSNVPAGGIQYSSTSKCFQIWNGTAWNNLTLDSIVSSGTLEISGNINLSSGSKFKINGSDLAYANIAGQHNNDAHSETYITVAGVTYENLSSNGDVGTVSGTLCAGNDSRLSDSRQCNNNFDNAATARSNLDVPSNSDLTSGLALKLNADDTAQLLTSAQKTELVNASNTTLHWHQTDRDMQYAVGTLDTSHGGTGRTDITTIEYSYLEGVRANIQIQIDNKQDNIIQNTAFNKNFAGTGSANTVSRSDHTHDDRYYTETEINSMIGDIETLLAAL